MTFSGASLPGHQPRIKTSESRMVAGLRGGGQGGASDDPRKCRSIGKVQVWQKGAGGAGAAGGAVRILHRLGLLAGLSLLAGCAVNPKPQIQYVRVEVPVQVPCRAREVAVPPWVAAGLSKTDSLEVKVRALLAERRQRVGYEKQLVAAVLSCR